MFDEWAVWQRKNEAGSQRVTGELASLGGDLDTLHQHVEQMGVTLEERAALVAYNQAQEVCYNALLLGVASIVVTKFHVHQCCKISHLRSMDLAPLKGEPSCPECLSYILPELHPDVHMLFSCTRTCQSGQASKQTWRSWDWILCIHTLPLVPMLQSRCWCP